MKQLSKYFGISSVLFFLVASGMTNLNAGTTTASATPKKSATPKPSGSAKPSLTPTPPSPSPACTVGSHKQTVPPETAITTCWVCSNRQVNQPPSWEIETSGACASPTPTATPNACSGAGGTPDSFEGISSCKCGDTHINPTCMTCTGGNPSSRNPVPSGC